MIILLVLLQVTCKLVDLLREDSDLHLRRAGILIMTAALRDDDVFLFEEKAPKVFVGHYFCKSRGSKALTNAKEALSEMMEGASVIMGFTPVENKPACLFARKLGFKSNGLIDTAFCKAEFFSMTKQEWNEKHG